ncbi:MAG TPA: YvcK family protein [Nanoarchaeota archaeon]|nr:MAG: hypothetical protein QT01_C0001G0077 [archaeon GW2011_AR6]MBS3082591.1 YvcK family protein [Candidatus Pacearchaeota archaeon]HIH17448.1 YvcK family protein [Nanoarchaeota archaeon]HIH33969.1 YvcK family protein [Nanoarchaeota archaeon]HIH51740.1 YvcK family protein [Nanoarchaeota archaeon]
MKGIKEKKTKNLVVLGGGTGLFTLLSGLKDLDFNITAIVATSDDGGSSGVLRDEYGILPPGDIRRCLVALSHSEKSLRQLFEFRFQRGGLKGHSFGNLLITALREITGSFPAAIEEAARLLGVRGKVLPSTLSNVRLCAELENGRVVRGQVEVSNIKRNFNSPIKRLFLSPDAEAYPQTLKEIKEADLIVLGPGSLYSSVLPNLLVKDIAPAICTSRAKKAYVVNIMTQPGETDGFSASKHVAEIESYLGEKLDYAIVNTAPAPKDLLKRYEEEFKVQTEPDVGHIGANVIKGDFLRKKNLLRHDSLKLAKAIASIRL